MGRSFLPRPGPHGRLTRVRWIAAISLFGAALAFNLLASVGFISAGRAGRRVAPLAAPPAGMAIAPFHAATPFPLGGADWVKRENDRPGTVRWRIPATAAKRIEGFADRVSVRAGEGVTLYVSTGARTFHVEAYRIGYYRGLGARLVWTSPDLAGKPQARPILEPRINMVEAHWTPSLRFQVTADWTEGVYLLKLVADTGAQSYVPLTVRDDYSRADLVIQDSVTTWEAYNRWGGYSLYQGPDGRFEDRSRVVSFDRPYDSLGQFFDYEMPLIVLAESLDLDVTYWTDVDLHERGALLLHHRALISLGHDEYWSLEMRQHVLSARSHGVNLAFLGGNADFRHIRLAPSALGLDRREIDYKRVTEDPLYGVDKAEVTGWSWREEPIPRPESTINGDLYQCNPVRADLIIFDPAAWAFAGTGLRKGDHLRDLVGYEYDRVDSYYPTPRTIQVLAHSPVVCRGQPDYSDMTYYSTASGAGVFDSGTTGWVSALRCGPPIQQGPCDRRVVRITANVLEAFAAGPAGRTHPSRSNLIELGVRLVIPLAI